ncbi:DNA-binding transcriptional LysR family regulator [Amaricoccus macauensis]|uniref:DNA-binding transcriptional LysR family regulator n=1 Tax=Amaricoccus macauensis TaxID=57001 RepID=A0A840STG4_9RHOB|nr:LysR family transcriptional regulator [Amaricoccus macauensis]MBB5224060.1 DNA-binding transcriptional LysR family regulator [Amaricoccus macauensis]
MEIPAGLDLVYSFLVVADELNFRRSAERLHVDQSALSRRIQKLEQTLGFRLLERTTREVSLTAAGRRFYKDNLALLNGYADSISAARGIAEGHTGTVRVGYMAFAATELVPRTVARFGKLHPHVDVKLRYIRTQGQKLALANDEIDIGYMIGPFVHSEYNAVRLASDPLYLVGPLNHPLLRLPSVRPSDLADADMILGDMEEWGEYRWRLSELFNGVGVALRVRLEASNTLALIGLVAAGLGVTIYPENLLAFLGRNVEARPIQHSDFRIETVLVWKRTNRSGPTQRFVEVATRLPAPL